MPERDRPHLIVPRPAHRESYTPPGGGGRERHDAPKDRSAHGNKLAGDLKSTQQAGLQRRKERSVQVEDVIDGIYVEFESFPGLELALESLDPQVGRIHPELVSVRSALVDGQLVERATVFVPDGTLGRFVRQIERYLETLDRNKPRYRKLLDSVRSVGLASLSALWTDPEDQFPTADSFVWWEVWLRRRDGREVERLRAFAEAVGAQLRDQRLGFADRTIVLLRAKVSQLAVALDVLDDLAELRRPREPGALLAQEPPEDQAAWAEQLLERTELVGDHTVAACVLDTGVHQAHRLLQSSLAETDCHTCNPAWGIDDRRGHGTEMAGIALYGDLGAAVRSAHRVEIRHRLESVKILPESPDTNPPELWGAITASATSLVEIQAPARRRAFAMAVTAESFPEDANKSDPISLGQPTSWSATVDALAAGRAVSADKDGLVLLEEDTEPNPRLFILAAGNIRTLSSDDYLERCDVEAVEDPGQAWNALTVGAFTDLDDMSSAEMGFDGWQPVAERGDLSPFSRTSVAFHQQWPVKPDVVFEGGNLARSPAGGSVDHPGVLQLLTTKVPFPDARLFTTTNGTSPATAQAAHLAASIMALYPTLWPETVRALIAHSAEWTPAMLSRFDSVGGNRRATVGLHRRYGMGVPDLTRATRSATDALTLIAQDVIHPFDGEGRMGEMNLHDLPWPVDVLSSLGEAPVRLRVTLSYFVEPNPSRRGWIGRFRYASHGLRFDFRRAAESTSEFRRRRNRQAREAEGLPATGSDAREWRFGPDHRVAGSLHSDIWQGTAADLARRGVVAVYPVAGWWKDRKDRDRSDRGVRYSLVVSIDTPEQDVDIWTPVAQEIGIPIVVASE